MKTSSILAWIFGALFILSSGLLVNQHEKYDKLQRLSDLQDLEIRTDNELIEKQKIMIDKTKVVLGKLAIQLYLDKLQQQDQDADQPAEPKQQEQKL